MLEHCITSFVDGRVRLRHATLRRAGILPVIEGLLRGLDGVEAVTTNPRSGSLLLEYDPTRLTRDDLLALLRSGESLLGAHMPETRTASGMASHTASGAAPNGSLLSGLCSRRTRNRCMLAALAGSALLGLWGRGGWHKAISLVFLGLCAEHVYRYRGRL